ncbi:hypothetical protein PTKIN_Ptkin15bG0002900 [Pterospermum kingtungense]
MTAMAETPTIKPPLTPKDVVLNNIDSSEVELQDLVAGADSLNDVCYVYDKSMELASIVYVHIVGNTIIDSVLSSKGLPAYIDQMLAFHQVGI